MTAGGAARLQVDGATVRRNDDCTSQAACRTRNVDIAELFRGTRGNREVSDRKTMIGGQAQGRPRGHDAGHGARPQVGRSAVQCDHHLAGQPARRACDHDVAALFGSPRRNRDHPCTDSVIVRQRQGQAHRRDGGGAARLQVDGATVRRNDDCTSQAACRTHNVDIAELFRGTRGNREVSDRKTMIGGQAQSSPRRGVTLGMAPVRR